MIIGLTGYPRTGKDEIANYLVSKYKFKKVSINEPMRVMLSALNPILFDGLRVQEALSQHGYDKTKDLYPEYRHLLQKLGKEASRDIFGENFWIDVAMQKVGYDNVVMNDVRFANEAKIIKMHGLVFKVIRPGTEPTTVHASDVGVPDDLVDHRIINDADIPTLYQKIDSLVRLLRFTKFKVN